MVGHNKLPPLLYKYRTWENEKHRRILTNNEIFFSSAREFNDPFDCQLNVRWDLITDGQALSRIKRLIKEESPNLPDMIVKTAAKHFQGQKHYRDVENLRYHDSEIKRHLAEEHGIFGLCETAEDIVMWSHYSDCHKGFCVAFDFKKLDKFFEELCEQKIITIIPYPITYQPNYPDILFTDNDFSLEILTKKSGQWSNEKEWRFILFGATDYSISLPDGIISHVILGCNITECHKLEIAKTLKSRDCKIDLYQAVKKHFSFGLKFEKLEL